MERYYNRAQKRKLKKRLGKSGISVDIAIDLMERRLADMNAEPLHEGDRVMLNYDKITQAPNYDKRQDAYKAFVEEHKEDEFTVEFDEKHTSGKLVCFKEDTSDTKWLWYVADLKKVSSSAVEEADGNIHGDDEKQV